MFGLDFTQIDWKEIWTATLDTLRMLGASALFSFIIGLPIGVLLYMAARSTSGVVRFGYSILSFIVNILRSVPFIILIVAMIPITKSLVGVSYGVLGTIPPLVIGAAPFFARLVETALNEVDKGVIEAAHAMGLDKPNHMEGSPSGGSSGLAGWDDDHDCNPGIVYRDVRSSRGRRFGRFGHQVWILPL